MFISFFLFPLRPRSRVQHLVHIFSKMRVALMGIGVDEKHIVSTEAPTPTFNYCLFVDVHEL